MSQILLRKVTAKLRLTSAFFGGVSFWLNKDFVVVFTYRPLKD